MPSTRQRNAGPDGSLRPNARLAVLPGTTHCDVRTSPLFLEAVTPFTDTPVPDN